MDINAWKPVKLRLNVQVVNNNNAPLIVRNVIDGGDSGFLNVEFFYEQNVSRTVELKSKPGTDIKIIFYYGNSYESYRQKVFLYHTTLEDVQELNYTIDCSTF